MGGGGHPISVMAFYLISVMALCCGFLLAEVSGDGRGLNSDHLSSPSLNKSGESKRMYYHTHICLYTQKH